MPYESCIDFPEYAHNREQDGMFGDVGTYHYEDNSFSTSSRDGRLNWEDLNFIETYYKKCCKWYNTQPG